MQDSTQAARRNALTRRGFIGAAAAAGAASTVEAPRARASDRSGFMPDDLPRFTEDGSRRGRQACAGDDAL